MLCVRYQGGNVMYRNWRKYSSSDAISSAAESNSVLVDSEQES